MTTTFNDPIEQQLSDFIHAHEDELIDFCRRLIQTPSVNGEHDEVHLANLIASEAQRLGLPVQIVGEFAQRPNVIVSTRDDGETGLLLLGHLDTVPPGDLEQWQHPPFAAEIDDGRIYGRGAVDTKGGMAASLYALAALAHTGALTNGRAQFIGVPDEETGATGTLGIKYLAANGLLSGKGAIYAYSGSEIILGHRGVLRYRLICTGEAVHTGSFEWQEGTAGASAVTGMARLLLELEKLTFPYSPVPYFERYRTVVSAGTVISGGASINIVPDRCEALVDIRTTPENNDPVTFEAAFADAAAIAATQSGVKFRFERLNYLPAAISDENAAIFTILGDVIPRVRGVPAVKTVAGPANEGYLLIDRGIPTVCGFGPTGENAHATDEYVDTASLADAALIFALTARGLDE